MGPVKFMPLKEMTAMEAGSKCLNFYQMERLVALVGWSVDLSGNKMIVGTAHMVEVALMGQLLFLSSMRQIFGLELGLKLGGANNYCGKVGISECVAIIGTHSGKAFCHNTS